MQLRGARFPSSYDPLIQQALKKRGHSLDEPARLSDAVMKLSNFYLENPSAPTPWDETWAQIASLVYFFPLNYARNSLVTRECRRLGFFNGLTTAVDDGAGMGSGVHAFRDILRGDLTWLARDVSHDALTLLNELTVEKIKTENVVGHQRMKSGRQLLLASYVFTELKDIPREWLDYEALIIIEPSTRNDARRLQAERPNLIEAGFSLWAPCPHQQDCPLLVSERDWCHDRVHFEAPAWFTAIEKHLPIKNRTLSFSYLAARKTPSPLATHGVASDASSVSDVANGLQLARLVGDTLDEKGKSRQALCRSSEREFLAWFPQRFKTKTHLEMSRGSLVRLADGLEKKQQEVRLREPSQVTELATDEPV
jgi:hypothetical protein